MPAHLAIKVPIDPSSPYSLFPPAPGISEGHRQLHSPFLHSSFSITAAAPAAGAGSFCAPICMSLTRLSPLRAVFCFLLPRIVSIWDSLSNPWLPEAFLSSHLTSALPYYSLLGPCFIFVCECMLWIREAPCVLTALQKDVMACSSLHRISLEKKGCHIIWSQTGQHHDEFLTIILDSAAGNTPMFSSHQWGSLLCQE